MSSTLLNISGKIDPATVALYRQVSEVADELNMPYMVVGASARDLVLHHGYGARIQRATTDVDFAVQVASWQSFSQLKQGLLNSGFSETDVSHRLLNSENIPIDIVPFGTIENTNAEIAWPPNGEVVMSVVGFQEACNHAEWVCIQEHPAVIVPVVTPAGMALLKLIAWMDRDANQRRKDARDFAYLCTEYDKIPTVLNQLYDSSELMESYDWDVTLAGACQLGADAADMAGSMATERIANLMAKRNSPLNLAQLVEEMCERTDQEYEYNEQLALAFGRGFLSTKNEE